MSISKPLMAILIVTSICTAAHAADLPITDSQSTPEIITDTSATPDASIMPDQLFPDLPKGSDYYLAVKFFKDNNLIQGYPDGLFRPDQEINRAEALKVLVGAIEFDAYSPVEKPLNSSSPENTVECDFPDLDSEAWYYSYVCSAFGNEVIEGYPDGYFRPAQTINKVESLKVIVLQSGLHLPTDFADNFADVPLDAWFAPYTHLAEMNTYLVPNRNDEINPAENMTRGEFALLMYRVVQNRLHQAEFGKATYYGYGFDGRNTASGTPLNLSLPQAAHKTLPFGTIVRVTNTRSGKSVDVEIVDRGPYIHGNIIDLTTSAFESIASLSAGVVPIKLEIID